MYFSKNNVSVGFLYIKNTLKLAKLSGIFGEDSGIISGLLRVNFVRSDYSLYVMLLIQMIPTLTAK